MQNQHVVTDLPQVRRQKILLLLERDGRVLASALSSHFEVSEDTIRRDLAELAEAGLVQRVHGGALPRPRDSGKDYFARLNEPAEVKRQLAQLAAQQVQNGQVVVFDSGTTPLQIARSLPVDIRITAITASPMTAIALADHPGVSVIVAGGQLNPRTMAANGQEALQLINSVKADLLFTGVCALHPEVGLSSPRFEEVQLKRAMLDCASHVIAVTTADKLGAVEPFVIAPCNRIHSLYTEARVASGDLDDYRRQGLNVRVAEG
jgi:DeoR/GlpR family transcriptional regulator of sugar metabolism